MVGFVPNDAFIHHDVHDADEFFFIAKITIRPICFSGKTFAKLPPDLQAAIVRAGKEAGTYGRQIESGEDTAKLDALEKANKLKRVPFADRDAMKKLVDPVMDAYAKEVGAEAIFAKIKAL